MIVNSATGKIYVGSAVNFKRRWWVHTCRLRDSKHDNPKLQAAWNAYGEKCFEFKILEIVEDKANLIEREQFWLDWTDCYNSGYNILKIAGSSLGYRHTEEFKRKRSELYKGRKQSPELIEKRISKIRGKTHSEQSKENMRKAKLNQSEETKRKIGLAHKGKKISEEHKKIVSEAAKKLALKRKADSMFKLSLENKIKWQKPQE